MNFNLRIVLTVCYFFSDGYSCFKLFILIVYLLALFGDSSAFALILLHLFNKLFIDFILGLKLY